MIEHVVFFGFFRLIHLLAVITVVGGTIMLRYVIMPAMHAQPAEARRPIHEMVQRRLAVIYPTAIGLILISGIVNVVRAYTVAPRPPMVYDMILGVKLLLAFALFIVAFLLVIPGDNPVQQKRRFWMTFNVHIAVLIVILSVTLRFLSGK